MNEPPISPQALGELLATGITAYADTTSRSLQKGEGQLGPSDIGFCRQKAALVTRQVEPSDGREKLWSAVVGSALHDYIAGVLNRAFPEWIIEGNGRKVEINLASGVTMYGTPDIVIPEWNMLIDLKSKDGFTFVRREGASQNNKYQRWMYAKGAVDEGLLDGGRPIWVANVYLDRSGKNITPHVEMEQFDWSLEDPISDWISDVKYAVTNNEDAPRDVPASVCQQICEYFTVCRGGLPMDEGQLIDDEAVLEAVDVYTVARDQIKHLKQQMEDAKAMLTGINGSTGVWQVRTTHVPASEVKASVRSGYDKVEVVRVPRRG